MTRTRKLRRSMLSERYEEMLSTMYGSGESVKVRAAVKYRDGREGIVETTVHVATMETEES